MDPSNSHHNDRLCEDGKLNSHLLTAALQETSLTPLVSTASGSNQRLNQDFKPGQSTLQMAMHSRCIETQDLSIDPLLSTLNGTESVSSSSASIPSLVPSATSPPQQDSTLNSPQSSTGGSGSNSILPLHESYTVEELRTMPLDGLYDDEFYMTVVSVFSKSLHCGSEHANRMLAGLAVSVLFRCQHAGPQESLKYVIIDRISIWTGLSRLNASKIGYLSSKIYQNAHMPAYCATIGDWANNLNPENSFLAELTKIVLWWKSCFPKKFSFYQLQMAAAELGKKTREQHKKDLACRLEKRRSSKDSSSPEQHHPYPANHQPPYINPTEPQQQQPQERKPSSSSDMDTYMAKVIGQERERILENMSKQMPTTESFPVAAAAQNSAWSTSAVSLGPSEDAPSVHPSSSHWDPWSQGHLHQSRQMPNVAAPYGRSGTLKSSFVIGSSLSNYHSSPPRAMPPNSKEIQQQQQQQMNFEKKGPSPEAKLQQQERNPTTSESTSSVMKIQNLVD